MLSSIHPLGERARHNRWAITAASFTAGAALAGSTIGLALGALGGAALGGLAEITLLAITGGIALLAGALDWAGIKPPGPKRQVNEHWIGSFRGWVYGGAFGLELGSGFVTYIVTWGVYATYAAAMLTVSPMTGALVGLTFGLGRSISVLAAGFVDRPSRLTSFNRGLAKAGPFARRAASATFALGGALVLTVALI